MKEVQNNNLRIALSLWGRLILAGVMCCILFMSLSMLGNALLGENVGYQIVEVTSSGEDAGTKVVKEYRYAEGEKPITAEDLTLEENQNFISIREISTGKSRGLDIVSQLFMLVLHVIFPYGLLWDLGAKDENRVRYQNQKEDMMRGLKIGLLASVPAMLVYVLLVLSRLSVLPAGISAAYRLLNISFIPFINWLFPVGMAFMELPIWRVLLVGVTLIPVLFVSWGAYYLGYKQFSIQEHLTYKHLKKDE